jgi:hypothetical protein
LMVYMVNEYLSCVDAPEARAGVDGPGGMTGCG